MKKLGWAAAILSMAGLAVLAVATLVSRAASCSYDDVPNVWSCGEVWAMPFMYDIDVAIFLGAYPMLLVGLLLGVIWTVRKLYSKPIRKASLM